MEQIDGEPVRFRPRNPDLMPTAQGFDTYFGIPYSNDMRPHVMMRGSDELWHQPVPEQAGISTLYAGRGGCVHPREP